MKENQSEKNIKELFEIEEKLKTGTYNKKETIQRRKKEGEERLKGGNETLDFFKEEVENLLGCLSGFLFLLPRLIFENIILAFIFVPLLILIVIVILWVLSLIF